MNHPSLSGAHGDRMHDRRADPGDTATPSVLLCDDSDLLRSFIARCLRRDRFYCEEVSAGDQALQRLTEGSFDLVLLDVELGSGPDGLTTLRLIREQWSTTDLPVIMLTARSRAADVIRALDLGANDYLSKPIELPVLLARLRTHIHHRKTVRKLRISEERYKLAMRGSAEGLWDWDLGSATVFYSLAWCRILGIQPDDVEPTAASWFDRVHPRDVRALRHALALYLAGETEQLDHEYRVRHASGSYRWMRCRGMAVRDQEGRALRLVGSQIDIHEAKAVDDLTRLPNRTLFMEMLERAVERARTRESYSFALLFLDLDRFKRINDSLGHLAGDRLLRETSRRLRESLRDNDAVSTVSAEPLLARLGGDEFAILLDGVRSPKVAEQVARKLQVALEEPFILDSQAIVCSASIGIALWSDRYTSFPDMLRDADTAMYRAKSSRTGGAVFFDAHMHEAAVQRLELEGDLRRALGTEQIQPWYQPIIDLNTGRITGFEALARWNHPKRGMVSPGQFIPVAEEAGLIDRLGRQVLRQALTRLAAWRALRPDLRMSVNLSPHQVSPALVPHVAKLLQELDMRGDRLVLELTETSVMGDVGQAREMIVGLAELGVHLSMDDFGTGHSSLSLLHELDFAYIKIDRSFVMSIDQPHSRFLVQAILAIGHSLERRVVAEGVETESALRALRNLECDFAQGYFFARPMPYEEALALLREEPRW